MANLAALRAAVFSLSVKSLGGGADNRLPGRARVNIEILLADVTKPEKSNILTLT